MSDENEAEIMEEMHGAMNSARIAQSLPDEYLKSILQRCKSDTPKTDAVAYDVGGHQHEDGAIVESYFARQLERELNAANGKLKRKCQCQAMKDARESGTDNEGYSSLIKGKHIGSGLPDIEFCPWCGGAV